MDFWYLASCPRGPLPFAEIHHQSGRFEQTDGRGHCPLHALRNGRPYWAVVLSVGHLPSWMLMLWMCINWGWFCAYRDPPGWAVTPRNEDGAMRDDTLVIDCGTCSEQGTKTCDDCVVTFLCGRDPEDAVVVDLAEFRAIRMLGDAGLVPPLRHTDSVRAQH